MPDEILLPKWFRLMKQIAMELAIGVIVAYSILQYIEKKLPPNVFQYINLILIPTGLVCIALSCSKAIEIIKKIKMNGK